MGYHKGFREENINVIDRILQRYSNDGPDYTLQKENSVIFHAHKTRASSRHPHFNSPALT